MIDEVAEEQLAALRAAVAHLREENRRLTGEVARLRAMIIEAVGGDP